MKRLQSPLDLPLALFIVSALVGVAVSYDRATSWVKFGLIVAAVVIYYVLLFLRGAPQLLLASVWLFLLFNVGLVAYFVTQSDFASQGAKFEPITALGDFLNKISPQLGLHPFHPNIVSGALEIALPLGLAVAARQMGQVGYHIKTIGKRSQISDRSSEMVDRRPPMIGRWSLITFVCSLIVCLILVFGLVMTSSRGAWLALGIVASLAVVGKAAGNRLRRYGPPTVVIGLMVALIMVIGMGEGFLPMLEALVGAVPVGNSAVSRVELFGQGWRLVQDYYYTGSGLGVFPMILSTYVLNLDVPFLYHIHNLFLQIWLEQGILGFVAFAWLIVAFYSWILKVGSWKLDTTPAADGGHETREGSAALLPSQCAEIRRNSPLNADHWPLITGDWSLSHWLFWGATAAATVMLVHGLADVLLYSSRGLPLIFVPMGVAVASRQSAVASRQTRAIKDRSSVIGDPRSVSIAQTSEANERGTGWGLKRKIATGFAVLVVSLLPLSQSIVRGGPPSVLATWYANLGSVVQTKVELGEYHWPDRLVGDVRQDCRAEPSQNAGSSPASPRSEMADCRLGDAEAHFRQALMLDSRNETARQRLESLALKRDIMAVD